MLPINKRYVLLWKASHHTRTGYLFKYDVTLVHTLMHEYCRLSTVHWYLIMYSQHAATGTARNKPQDMQRSQLGLYCTVLLQEQKNIHCTYVPTCSIALGCSGQSHRPNTTKDHLLHSKADQWVKKGATIILKWHNSATSSMQQQRNLPLWSWLLTDTPGNVVIVWIGI